VHLGALLIPDRANQVTPAAWKAQRFIGIIRKKDIVGVRNITSYAFMGYRFGIGGIKKKNKKIRKLFGSSLKNPINYYRPT